MDTLRNWELNGLLSVKRRQNGYRVYTAEDLRRLKIIRSPALRQLLPVRHPAPAGRAVSDPNADIRTAIDTPEQGDDIIAVCDKLLTSLARAGENARLMCARLEKMEHLFKTLHFTTRPRAGGMILPTTEKKEVFIRGKYH